MFNLKEIIAEDVKKKNPYKKIIKGKAITPSISLEADYYSQLYFMVNTIKKRFINIVMSEMEKDSIKEQFTDASYATAMNKTVQEVINKIKSQFDKQRLEAIAEKYLYAADKSQKYKFISNYGFGFDITKIPEFRGYKPFMNSMIRKNLSLITSLRNETLHRLEMALRVAVEQGKSTKQITELLINAGLKSRRKAAVIARNEIKNVTTQLNQRRLENAGFDMYEWSTSQDERVRGNPSGKYPSKKDNHYKMEGLICRFDDPTVYSKDGGLTWKKKSQDMPQVQAGEDIMCFLPNANINLMSKPLKIYKRFYTGSIVKITDETSGSISVTQNHPILTNRGWVFAKDINKSDKLIKSLFSYEVGISNTEINNNHILITDDIYNLFKIIFSSKRVAGAKVKFHGDVTDHEVEIIDLESKLPNGIESITNQEVVNKLLSITDFTQSSLFCDSHSFDIFTSTFLSSNRQMSISDLVNPLGWSHELPFESLGFALVSDFNFLFNESSSNNISACLKNFRDLILTYSRFIKSDNLRDIKIYSINGNPFVESTIIDITHNETSSNVYNLETENGLYQYNGIVSHNCRCVQIPYVRLD